MITEYTNYTKQNVPENIKAAGLNFSSLDISEEAINRAKMRQK